jgi:general secretion pathway protein N
MAVSRNPGTRPRRSWASGAWAFAGAILGLVLAVVLFAPARWLAASLDRGTQGRVQLTDVRGTVWNGSGQLLLTGGTGSKDTLAMPSRLDWTARPRWNGVMVELGAACCITRPVGVLLRPRVAGIQMDLTDGQTQWPAALLAGLGTPWNTLQFDGELLLSTQSLSVEWTEGRLAVAGRAELRAQRISSRLSTLRPMGSYRITVLGGPAPALQLETIEGALQLSGSGQWVGSRLRFSGTATAAPDREEALANLLNIIGRRSGARSIISIG